MRVLFAGTPEVAAVSLRRILDHGGHEVVAVLTRPDAHRGRGRKSSPSPVAILAREHGIEVLAPAGVRDPDFLARLRTLAPDCCPVVAYGGLIGRDALAVPEHGWVNLHFSVLPAWRGAAPVQWALISGDDVTGATTFALVPELDAGPVFGTLTEPIGSRDTAGDLLGRLADTGSHLLLDTLDGIALGALTPREQPVDGITLAPKLTVADGEIDWAGAAAVIDRRIRGYSPAPGAWTTLRGERVKLLRSHLPEATDPPGAGRPGELLASKHAVQVVCGRGVVELDQVQPSGKAPMAAADWVRGLRLEPGEGFGTGDWRRQ